MKIDLKNKLNKIPIDPGVYQFSNTKKQIIYIGKAKNLKKRVLWLKRVLPLTWEELISDKESKDSKIDYFFSSPRSSKSASRISSSAFAAALSLASKGAASSSFSWFAL